MLNRLAICWALLAALFGFVVGGSFVAATLHVPVSQIESASSQQASEQKSEQHGPLRRLWNWTTHDAVSFYTFVLAVFTGVLAVSTVLLGIATVGLYRAGERQIAVAKQSADAAMVGARAAIDSNRAWLSIKKVEFVKNFATTNGGTHIYVGVELENIGNSPATDVGIAWVQMAGIASGEPITKFWDKIVAESHRRAGSGQAIFPGKFTTQHIASSILKAELDNIETFVLKGVTVGHLYLGVCVTYRSDASSDFKHTFRVLTLGPLPIEQMDRLALVDLNDALVTSRWDGAT